MDVAGGSSVTLLGSSGPPLLTVADRRTPHTKMLLCKGGALRLCDEDECPRQQQVYYPCIPAYGHLGLLCCQCSTFMNNCCKAYSELPPGRAGDPEELRMIATAYRSEAAEAARGGGAAARGGGA
jgi:hypothetical protein